MIFHVRVSRDSIFCPFELTLEILDKRIMNSNSVGLMVLLGKANGQARLSVLARADSYLFKYWLLRFMDEREVETTS